MAETKQVTLPITGMTCANCVATIERNLKKLPGIENAAVNLASERATVEFDPGQLALEQIIGEVEKVGYGVAKGEADFSIRRISDGNDVKRLEKSLEKIQGVLNVHVNLTTEHLKITYIPTLVSQNDLRNAVRAAGFTVIEIEGVFEDAEAKARQKAAR